MDDIIIRLEGYCREAPHDALARAALALLLAQREELTQAWEQAGSDRAELNTALLEVERLRAPLPPDSPAIARLRSLISTEAIGAYDADQLIEDIRSLFAVYDQALAARAGEAA